MTSMNFNETLSLQQYESYLINKMHYWSHKQRPISDLDTAPSVNYKPDQFTMSLTKMKSLKKGTSMPFAAHFGGDKYHQF